MSVTSQRATCWSLTINNPTPQDEEYIALARQKGWKVDGQLEKGAEGTSHYQLILKTSQVRFAQVKKAFPRAHIEIARNPAALQAYTHKTDTRLDSLPAGSERYPSLSKFWELIYDEVGVQWNADEPSISFRHDTVLLRFDELVDKLIRKGYHVETMAINPQIRSAFAKFSSAIFYRIYVDRQTRQTTQEIVVPTTHSQDGLEEEEGSTEASEEGSEDGSWASDESPF